MIVPEYWAEARLQKRGHREQIVERHGDAIITRNSYGARCINTPDVLFADVDFRSEPSFSFLVIVFFALIAGGAAAIYAFELNWGLLIGIVFVALIATYAVADTLQRIAKAIGGGPEALAEFFDALAVDPIYARMCQVQNCFRARVSPKPWRIGIGRHMKPRPGVWPVRAERMAERQRWIDEYEHAARNYASCRFVESLGSSLTDRRAQSVSRLHDRLCRSDRPDPIA